MAEISTLDLQNLRHLIGGFDTCHCKMQDYAAQAKDPEIKQLYINGHFCYVFKFGIVTNGLGIIRHISFYNKNFMASHPDIIVQKKSDSPDEDMNCQQ